MGLEVIVHQAPNEEFVTVNERLAITEDGEELVPEDDLRARWLFCTPGSRIKKADAERFGLLKGAKRAPATKQIEPQGDKSGPASPDTTVAPTDEAQAAADAANAVPSGNVAEVLEWVGDDVDRAALALSAENDRSRPRKSLVESLEAVVSGDADDGQDDDDQSLTPNV